ncbi:hypothetical protein BH23CHL2_BH23CHL2_21240 [soil metagenome]
MTNFSEVFDLIDTAVQRQMERDQIPGLSLAITSREGLIYQQTYGRASLETGDPVRPDHLFEFGSIGKSFTCIVLLQLVDEGRLVLDAPVTDYLPWFEVQSEFEPITLDHLMTHSAGIIRGTDFPADPRYEVWALRETRAVSPPGRRFHYSNVGYKALGLVLERVTGQTYGDLVRTRILEPLGMTDTDPTITHETRRRLVTGYQPFYDDRPWQRGHGHAPAAWFETNTADGCIAGTATDLASYLRMLMNGGAGPRGRILSESSFAAITASHINDNDPADAVYGYGLHVFTDDGRRYLGHGGGMVGYRSRMIADLTAGFGLVTLINGPGRQGPIISFVFDTLYAASQDEPLPELPPVFEPTRVESAADYAGVYRSESDSIGVRARNDKLLLARDGEEFPLEPRDNDTFVVPHPDFDLFLLHFDRDEDGAITSAVHGARRWLAPGQATTPVEFPEEWRSLAGHYRCHNPWETNFRIILRDGELILVLPDGLELPLAPGGDGVFRVGEDDSPEFIRFDTIVDGEAWRANYSGCDYYRFFTR